MTATRIIHLAEPGHSGAQALITRLNEMVVTSIISNWHLGHWQDEEHTRLSIDFGSPTEADAAVLVLRPLMAGR